MDSRLATRVPSAPVKQLGFSVKENGSQLPRRFSTQTIKEASTAEENGDADVWALPARWQPKAESPVQLSSQAAEGSNSSSDNTAGSAFKGFKDCCEAGSFTLAGSQGLYENGRLEVVGTAHTCPGVRTLVKSVVGGLRAWQQPQPSAEGLGGSYFFLDESGKKTAIVKPCDEEPLAPNNPKGFVGRALGEPGLKPTVRIGEAAMREVAAFLLDYDHFACVPHTVLVLVTHNVFHVAPGQQDFAGNSLPDSTMSCSQGSTSSFYHNQMANTVHPHSVQASSPPSKLASLQEYMQHHGDASEMGCSRFSVQDVHRIGILDLRLFNTDRHAGNMLVRHVSRSSRAPGLADAWLEDHLELIPIDHGFCLPEALEPPYLEWLHWPQAMIPFDEEELAYIARLDATADVIFLQQELPWLPEGSRQTLQVATLLLTKCAAAGLTLAEIGSVASRPLVGMEEEASQLESICLSARATVDAAMEETASDRSELEAFDEAPELEARDRSLSLDLMLGETERTSMVMGMQVPLQSTMLGDELLFDLDEDSAGANSPPSRKSFLSRRSQSSTSLQTGAQPQSWLQPVKSLDSPESQPGRAGNFAKSLATGMLHNRGGQRMRNHQYRGNAVANVRPAPDKCRRVRPAYPPPVVGGPASGLNSVFDGLDKSAWSTFMQALDALIQEALDRGIWKKQPDKNCRTNAGFGMSCPRF